MPSTHSTNVKEGPFQTLFNPKGICGFGGIRARRASLKGQARGRREEKKQDQARGRLQVNLGGALQVAWVELRVVPSPSLGQVRVLQFAQTFLLCVLWGMSLSLPLGSQANEEIEVSPRRLGREPCFYSVVSAPFMKF